MRSVIQFIRAMDSVNMRSKNKPVTGVCITNNPFVGKDIENWMFTFREKWRLPLNEARSDQRENQSTMASFINAAGSSPKSN